MRLRLFSLLLAGSAMAFGGIIDNFNRTNDPSGLGPAWTNIGDSSAEVFGGAARALNAGANRAVTEFNGVTSNTVYADVAVHDDSTTYIALVLGILDGEHNYFIKVQQQAATGFGYYRFCFGNNGINGCDGMYFLDTPFTSGHVQASMSGLTATLTVTPDGGGAIQTYSYTYAFDSGGTGIGLGFLGSATADNFGADAGPVPEPASLGLIGAGIGALVLLRRRVASL
jgi:hypothetical protein